LSVVARLAMASSSKETARVKRIAVIALAAMVLGSGFAWAGDDDARLRNATLKRSHGSVRLLIRAKGGLHAGDKVGVLLAGDLRFVGAAPVIGNRLKRWVIAPTSDRRRALLDRARRALESGQIVQGFAVIDDDPLLPDPAHRFTLRAFNKRAVIAR
jgi:hypothetical protein